MNILLITNLYPPQELGGYGRSMADFAWSLKELGHKITVICSDAPYLNTNSINKEVSIIRKILLKGSFKNGVTNENDPLERLQIDNHNIKLLKNILNQEDWHGILIGNIDLIGPEILPILVNSSLPVLHHIGFIEPSFTPLDVPKAKNYILLSASHAVKDSLINKGFIIQDSTVIYPGARIELFQEQLVKRKLPELPDGSFNRPLCIAFAGLLMSSKGLHILIEALAKLKHQGIFTRTLIAGSEFQNGYKEALEYFLEENGIKETVTFTGSLDRLQLARFFRLNHVFVFPSIYPEAFGIVQAEAMASGLTILSSGVGGSKELIRPGINGWVFKEKDSNDLAKKLYLLAKKPKLIEEFGKNGKIIAKREFSTINSAKSIEKLFLSNLR